MNVVLQRTPDHTTRGLSGYYIIARDALTTRRVAMLQVVTLADGTIEYRDTNKQPMPVDSFDAALRLAMAQDVKRRAQRPPSPPRPKPARGGYRGRRSKQERYYTPPAPIRPMRRLLVGKLAERYGKAVA